MTRRTTQYTIRGVGPEVDQALRRMAKEERLSLNRYLVKALQRVAGESAEPIVHHDLDFVIGSMTDRDLVTEALEEFSVIDEDLWK